MKKEISLWELFFTFFKINLFTFGGGYTIVPIIRDEFVEKKQLIGDEEMMDLIALSQSGPGAMAISCSLLTGYKIRGMTGAITCVLASTLPGVIIIFTISQFYQAFRANFYVNAALAGISGIVSAMLLVTVFNLGKTALKRERNLSIAMIAFAIVMGYFTNLNTGLVIILMGLCGVLISHYERRKQREES
ncbi:MAG: chromate transporter [Tissierellia bacterium]|nr:chromate transporter [Tissierellia bacterium]